MKWATLRAAATAKTTRSLEGRHSINCIKESLVAKRVRSHPREPSDRSGTPKAVVLVERVPEKSPALHAREVCADTHLSRPTAMSMIRVIRFTERVACAEAAIGTAEKVYAKQPRRAAGTEQARTSKAQNRAGPPVPGFVAPAHAGIGSRMSSRFSSSSTPVPLVLTDPSTCLELRPEESHQIYAVQELREPYQRER